MDKTIELEDLIKLYGEETVADIVNHWQESIFVHPMTCHDHSDVSLIYEKGQMYCPEPNCQHHQHWIPSVVMQYWLDIE